MIVAPNWLGDAVMALPAIADVRNGSPGVAIAVAARSSIAPPFSLVHSVDDAVMALPAIADVRRGQPDASIAVAARPSVAPLFTLVPGVDEVVALSAAGPSLLAGRDAALLLPNSFRSALMARRAGVPERWGYSTDWRGLLLTRGVPRPPPGLHQIDYYQHLVRALGFPTGPDATRLDLPPALREAGANVLRHAGWDGRTPIVALAPGAAYGSAKRWPSSAFADLAAGLADEGVACLIVGAAADRGTADEVSRAIGSSRGANDSSSPRTSSTSMARRL